ncbi:MAG: hypothetical protein ACO3R5_14595, partial [Pseudohongiellaceae bacterium]
LVHGWQPESVVLAGIVHKEVAFAPEGFQALGLVRSALQFLRRREIRTSTVPTWLPSGSLIRSMCLT